MENIIQDKLAQSITKYVLMAVGVLSALGLGLAVATIFIGLNHTADDTTKITDNSLKVVQFIFASILPLLGTWIGTVLAFYFSKENFIAANQSVKTLVDKLTSEKKLASINVKDQMIPIAAIDKWPTPYDSADVEGTILLKEVLSFLETKNRNRLVLLSSQNVAKLVVHKSIFTEFISKNATSFDTWSIKNMRETGTDRIKDILNNSIAFVDENATMQTAKKKMEEKNQGTEEICQDVFITATGAAEEPVIGWLTNIEIAKNSIVE